MLRLKCSYNQIFLPTTYFFCECLAQEDNTQELIFLDLVFRIGITFNILLQHLVCQCTVFGPSPPQISPPPLGHVTGFFDFTGFLPFLTISCFFLRDFFGGSFKMTRGG